MDYWEHARLSVQKFGGQVHDYLAIHRFIDSGKLFRHHLKHRLLLHNQYGAELAIELFDDHLENADGRIVLVRDVVHAHCREDLDGRVPSLNDWLDGVTIPGFAVDDLPDVPDREIRDFLRWPYRRSGLDASLAITYSDFGVYLVERFFGPAMADELAAIMAPLPSVGRLLDAFVFDARWQYSPRRHEIAWLDQAPT